nr:MAG TPA_asm: hypothetical protein [Caudoviricetes sp.]
MVVHAKTSFLKLYLSRQGQWKRPPPFVLP